MAFNDTRRMENKEGIKMTWLENKIINHYKQNGSLPHYYNAWNDEEIKDASPTLTVNCGSACARSGLLIIEEIKDK